MPIRAVVDTNLIVSGVAFPRGNPFELIERWRSGSFQLVTSNRQLIELSEVLERPKIARLITPELAQEILYVIGARAEFVSIDTIAPRVRDPEDDVILAAAVDGKADYLVTGDKDLLVLATVAEIAPLKIISVVEFLSLLERAQVDAKGG